MTDNYQLNHEIIGDINNANTIFVFGHGWGFDKNIFIPFANALIVKGSSILINFPGFGGSEEPPENWTTKEYADITANLIKQYKGSRKVIYIGHSFGGRIGIRICSQDLVDAMVLLASAGIPKHKPLPIKLLRKAKVFFYKFLKPIPLMLGIDLDKLKGKFGSVDYRSASPVMRKILNNVVGENLSEEAKNIKIPVLIIYGDKDTETPPAIGKALHKLIANSSLVILKDQDHHSILMNYKQPVIRKISDFVLSL